MTEIQKATLRLSEVRSRLNAIGGMADADMTEEIRTESGGLETEYQNLETRFRALTIAEGDGNPADLTRNVEDGESGEVRDLRERAQLRHYLSAAAGGSMIDGPESELNAALGIGGRAIPMSALVPNVRRRPAEARADARTPIPSTGAPTDLTFVERVFSGGAGDFLGVRFETVAHGEKSFWQLSAGGTPSIPATKAAATDSAAATFTPVSLSPKLMPIAYRFALEDLATAGPELENALRMDAAGAIREAGDRLILSGTGANRQPSGLLVGLAAATDPGATVTYEDAIEAVSGGVDGKFARSVREVRGIFGVESYKKISGLFTSAGTDAASDYLNRNGGGVMASALIPAPTGANKIQTGVTAATGVGGNAAFCMWDSLTVRDEMSHSNTGEVRLTVNALVDFGILRSGGFRLFKLRLGA